MHPLLCQVEHRPFPLPRRPWVMMMRWHDLLFAHWALEPDSVRAAMPHPLRHKLEVHQGKAWVGVVPFWMSDVRLRATPAMPKLSTFPELNVRTYVRVNGRAGIYFFSLDTTRWAAVLGARWIYNLRYFHARIRIRRGKEWHWYSSERRQPPRPAVFRGRYRALEGESFLAREHELENFLVERYCLYAVRRGQILRGDIHHTPWELRTAEAEIWENNVAQSQGLELPANPPLLHYASQVDALAWWPEQITRAAPRA